VGWLKNQDLILAILSLCYSEIADLVLALTFVDEIPPTSNFNTALSIHCTARISNSMSESAAYSVKA